VNIFNRESWKADRGWSSNLGVGRRANNHPRKKTVYVENYLQAPRKGRAVVNTVMTFGFWRHGVSYVSPIKRNELSKQKCMDATDPD
jgi:hypothetical protein